MSSAKTYEKKHEVRNSVGRLSLVAVAVLLEGFLLLFLWFRFNEKYAVLDTLLRIAALLLGVWIFSQERSASVKMPWIALVMLLPIVGVTLYLMVGLSGSTRRMRQRYREIDEILFPLLRDDSRTLAKLNKEDPGVANLFRYTSQRAGFPVYENTDVEFFHEAADGLAAQKEALRKARKFIFMEYHAIEDAEAFGEVKEILAAKAAEGVDVRVVYDDMGSIGFLDHDFIRRMEARGIRCRVFNPVTPVINVFLNNRDHRKITVVDGKVGFTGGYNLANEYFGLTRPYGRWKDSGVKLTGEGVRSLTVMFLEMWNVVKGNDINDAYFARYLPAVRHRAEAGCFVQPYGDTPLDNEHVGENVYLNLINYAAKSVWIVTPYLIISDEMNRALTLAAARGVDVRIITPGVPDKKVIYGMTRSYYRRLARDGVRIFEYLPGFCHAKQCVADGKVALCGTVNLDYRSFYHHFEDGCMMYGGRAVQEIRRDFEEMFSDCLEVTARYAEGRSRSLNLLHHVLRMLSPLL